MDKTAGEFFKSMSNEDVDAIVKTMNLGGTITWKEFDVIFECASSVDGEEPDKKFLIVVDGTPYGEYQIDYFSVLSAIIDLQPVG